jgi:hypothetical protein
MSYVAGVEEWLPLPECEIVPVGVRVDGSGGAEAEWRVRVWCEVVLSWCEGARAGVGVLAFCVRGQGAP